MNITIHLGSWMLPAIVTLISLGVVSIVAFTERNDHSWLSGLGTLIAALICLPATLIAWIVWALMKFFT